MVARWVALALRRQDWSSHAFFVEGIVVIITVGAVRGRCGKPVRNGFGVTTLGAGEALPSVSRASMMKRTVGAGGMFLGASGRGVSKLVAVGTLGVAVSLHRFLDLEGF